ncbi:hypothetical protein [Pseudomonas sp. COR18]|uniref:hypothetical protein n=1 Tax=Pseudomonas sp. COR18 TaxID=3399680 RepID=UPI003B002037
MKQANAVFAKLPRHSPLQEAQQAFERRFPQEPRPLDLNNLHLRVYRLAEPPQVVASPSVAELIAAHYGGRDISDLLGRYPFVPGPLYYGPGNTYRTGSDRETPSVPGFISAQDVLHFIRQLPSNTARDMAARQARDFTTPGEDGRKPRTKLGEIRQQQIALEAQQQEEDRILDKAGKALVDMIVNHPSATDLERAYPDERTRPQVYSLAVRANGGHDRYPPLTLQGPFVMVQPAVGDDDEHLVLYLPKLGLKAFNSRQELLASIALSPALGKFLPEQVQARLPQATRYVLDTLEPIPADRNVFEHSIRQQIDKQERDTRYRLEQAGKRGADLVELDAIAGHSTRDFRRSFEPPRFVSHPPPPRQPDVKAWLTTSLRA